MRYARAKCDAERETLLYREYVTESLRLQGEHKYLSRSWSEVIAPQSLDTRSGDEIAAEVIARCGLTMKGGETE